MRRAGSGKAPTRSRANGHTRAVGETKGRVPATSRRAQPAPSSGGETHLDTLAALAHEFRTPLATLQATLELLTELPSLTTNDAEQLIRRAQRGVGWLEGLVENLTTWAALQTGQVALRRATVRVDDCVDLALSMVQPFLDRKEQRVRVVCPTPSPLVLADPQRLGQVLINLLTNASGYSDWGAAIDLTVLNLESAIEVRVTDRGPGIPEEEQAHIFDRYVRGTNAAPRAGSLGLGLHIVKTLVELHGGTVGVDSAPGKGASFWFTLARPVDRDADALVQGVRQTQSGTAQEACLA